jgi:hypothetical protein
MSFNPATYLENTSRIITGKGFKKMASIDLNSLRVADGTIMTASTEPSREALETSFIGMVATNNQTVMGCLAFEVPQDYDASVDKLRFRFLVNSGGTTNEPILDATIYKKRVGVALSSDLNPTASPAIPKTSATTGAAWREIVCDGKGLLPGDALTVQFISGAHSTDTVATYAFEVVYASDLVYYNLSDRSLI